MDWLRDNAWQGWMLLAVVLGALEMLGLDLFLVMLAGGALVGGLTALADGPFGLQVALALLTSVALLGLVRPSIIGRLHSGPQLRTGHQGLIGHRATVLRELSTSAPGRVKVEGEEWTALPYDEDDQIEAGTLVDVVMIKGATAYVLRSHPPTA
jgi:membrane protein implicated in regulation of membrane protease activity